MANTRRGYMLMETMAGAAVLAVLITICLQMFASLSISRRAAERRAMALQEAANTIERVSALSWDEITSEKLATMTMTPSVQELLVGGALKLTLRPVETAPPAKQVQVEITWRNDTGGTDAPVRLNYWFYAQPGGSP